MSKYKHPGDSYVRASTFSEQKVRCPHADGYGQDARPGDFVTFQYRDDGPIRYGRVLGRVDAPRVPSSSGDPIYDVPEVKGHLAVLELNDRGDGAYVRWVDPLLVDWVGRVPTAFARFFFQKELPDVKEMLRLNALGALREEYIEKYTSGAGDKGEGR